MKNWSASRLLPLVTLVLALLGGARRAWAGTPAEGMACLERVDIACAMRAGEGMGDSPHATHFQARLAFYLGHFEQALDLLQQAKDDKVDEEDYADDREIYTATVAATHGFITEHRGDVEIRYSPGTDAVLLDEAFEVLQAAHDRIGERLGGAPPGGVRMEIYPTADSFIAASSLPAEAVRTTGVVALSKWTRLLVTSPKALGRGYAWKDTIAHEYIHYIVAYHTGDLAPVWLQEGIARSHEVLWRQDDFAALPAYQQSLLAEALAKNDLVKLQEMHPSMAYLPSAEKASLAFAEVCTMVEHLEAVAGTGATRNVLARVKGGTDALTAVTDVAGARDSDAFMDGWKASLGEMRLVKRKLEAMPTVLGPPDDAFGIDPVLAQRADLAGHARIGDLLHQQGLDEAALLEYQEAVPEDEPASPLLAARIARALVALGKVDDAIHTLSASIGDYPEFATTRKDLGDLLLKKGQQKAALAEYRASADVNPFDPEVQAALSHLYTSLGDTSLAERHQRYRQILLLGGPPPAGATQ
jgi:tetratricopeptide (TPR) repeat protein